MGPLSSQNPPPTHTVLARGVQPRRRPLPFPLTPGIDETWQSYLTRVSITHECTLPSLAAHIGLRDGPKGGWPAYFGAIIDSPHAQRAAWYLHLTAVQVHTMQLERYDRIALDLTALRSPTGINSTRLTNQQSWIHLAGSAFCPHCLAEDDQWRLRWRLPWSTICPRHQCYLVHQCPTCHNVPGLRNLLHSTAPGSTDHAVPNHRCAHPSTSLLCEADLGRTHTIAAPLETVRRATLITSLLDGKRGRVAGELRPSLATLQAWRYTICLASHLGQLDDVDWGRTHRWTLPSRNPLVTDRLLATAEPVLQAADAETAADTLNDWCRDAGHTSIHAGIFRRASQGSEHLGTVIDTLLARRGRAHVLARRRLPPGILGTLTVDHIPQLLWTCALPAHLRNSTRPDAHLLRAVQALIIARAVTDSPDWATTATLLGLPPSRARQWARYCFRAKFSPLKDELIQSAHHTARLLARYNAREAWWPRPHLTGGGLTIFADAQTGQCRLDATHSSWCPCMASPQ